MSLVTKIKALQDKRNQLRSEGLILVERADSEKREMSAEEIANWEQCCKDQAVVEKDLNRYLEQAEREVAHAEQDARMARLAEPQELLAGRPERPPTTEPEEEAEEFDENGKRRITKLDRQQAAAFNTWLRVGFMLPQERAVMAERAVSSSNIPKDIMQRINLLAPEMKAQLLSGQDNVGGYTVPTLQQGPIEKAMLAYGGIRKSRVKVRQTKSGADLPMPTVDDTANRGRRLAEGVQANTTQFGFGSKILHAYMYTSDIVPISLQLLADSAEDMVGLTADLLGERLGRIMNLEDTIGTGASMPEGLFVAPGVGKTTAATTAVTFDEVYDLIASVNADYRIPGVSEFMFNDGTLWALKKLKDSQGRYLWQSGVATKEPDRIDQYTYIINYDAPAMGAGNNFMAFGDLSKFTLRDVLDIQMFRFNERYMDSLNIGFVCFFRHDAKYLNAGTGPIKLMANHA